MKIFTFADRISVKPESFLQVCKISFYYHKDKKFGKFTVSAKISQAFLPVFTVNHPNTTLSIVFEKLFLKVYRELGTKPVPNSEVSFILHVKGAGFLHLSKISFPLNHANRTASDLL